MNKTTGMVIGVLVVGALAVTLFDRGGANNSNGKLNQALFDSKESSSVSAITISNRVGESLELVKSESNSWVISKDKFPADAAKILQFLDKLSQMKLIRKIGSSPSNLAELGLDQPVKLALKSGAKVLLGLDIGSARKGGGSYVSFAGEKETYLLSQTLEAFTDLAEWELKQLVGLKKEDIQEVEFSPLVKVSKGSTADASYLLEGTALEQTDNNKITSAFGVFSNLTFTKRFSRDEAIPKKALESGSTIVVKNFAGTVYKIRAGKSTPVKQASKDKNSQAQVVEDRWFVAVSVEFSEQEKSQAESMKAMTDQWVFEIAPHYGRQFLKQKSDFIKPAQPKAPVAKTPTPPKQKS